VAHGRRIERDPAEPREKDAQRSPSEAAERHEMRMIGRRGAGRRAWEEGAKRDRAKAEEPPLKNPAAKALQLERDRAASRGKLRDGRVMGGRDKGGCIHNAGPVFRALMGSQVTAHRRPHGQVEEVPVVWEDGRPGPPHRFGKSPAYMNMLREHAEVDAMLDEAAGGGYWCDREHGSRHEWKLGKGFPKLFPAEGHGGHVREYPSGAKYRERWPEKAREFGRKQ
jgi:hypothetical protein